MLIIYKAIMSNIKLYGDPESVSNQLNCLSEKYDLMINSSDPVILNKTDQTIKQLKQYIEQLEEQNMNKTLEYNLKIERLKDEHRKELYNLHKDYKNKLKKQSN
jgi:tRNA A22 N-methylase